MLRSGIERAPLMCRSSDPPRVRTSIPSAGTPRSSAPFSSSTVTKATGYSGSAAGAAATRSSAASSRGISARPTPSPPPPPGPAAHRGAPVAELLRLHGLALAAVGDRVEQEVRADGVHVHQVVAAVGGDAAVAVEAAQLAVPDLVDAAGGDPEVLAALGDRRDAVGGPAVTAGHPLQGLPRVPLAPPRDGGGHSGQRHHRAVGGVLVFA